MKNKTYGYIRVSTRDQNEDRQRVAMRAFGVPEKCMYMDKLSGRNFARPAYQALLRRLRPGDTLVVKSIDRLGRSYADVLENWRVITKEKGAFIVVLDMPILDTRADRDLMNVFISDIVLQILSYFAETERDFNRQRQAEGIRAAKERGVRLGRPLKKPPKSFPSILAAWRAGAISARGAARKIGVSHHTFLRWIGQKRNG